MRVYDVVNESDKDLEEGPLRFLKRKMGNQTAQLDFEIDKKTKELFKQYQAVVSQDPEKKGMTAQGIANYLSQKGFVSSPDAVMKYVNQDPSLGKTLRKAAGKAGKVLGKAAGAAAGVAKKAMAQPKGSGLTPGKGAKQLDMFNSIESMYAESILKEVDAKLSNAEVMKVIKRFVQQGFQKQVGQRLGRDEYGDAPNDIDPNQKQQMVQQAIKDLENMGYTVTPPKK